MKKQGKAIVALSGGQDSTTCLYWAKENYNEVTAVGFDYGQSHVIELEKAAKIAYDVSVPMEVYDIRGLLATSSLIEHTDHNAESYMDADLPASFTPGRNLLFLTVLASKAAEKGINNIITGVCETDYSGYPDCRRNTIDALQLAFNLGMGSKEHMEILTPLMYLDKAETWKLAKDLGCLDVIINDTMTDYDGAETMNEWGYGNIDNPASELRAAGYYKAKSNGWL